jgi:hypothetical protein
MPAAHTRTFKWPQLHGNSTSPGLPEGFSRATPGSPQASQTKCTRVSNIYLPKPLATDQPSGTDADPKIGCPYAPAP